MGSSILTMFTIVMFCLDTDMELHPAAHLSNEVAAA